MLVSKEEVSIDRLKGLSKFNGPSFLCIRIMIFVTYFNTFNVPEELSHSLIYHI